MGERGIEVRTLEVASGQMGLTELGKILAQSGYFADAKEAAQAVVKVLAGQELGFPPISSMTGIFIVKGRVTLSANMIAAAVKRTGKYNYLVRQMDNEKCVIEFYEGEHKIGVSTFTKEDAVTAGLANSENYRHYPRNMLFARAMSNGAKWYCPDIFGGPIYTPDELGATIDGETGAVLKLPAPSTQASKPEEMVQDTKPEIPQERPWTPDKLRELITYSVQHSRLNHGHASRTEEQAALIAAKLREIWQDDPYAEDNAHAVLNFLVGDASTKTLSRAQASVALDWLVTKDEEGNTVVKPYAREEAKRVLGRVQADAGQAVMFDLDATEPENGKK